jgi:hypothetical protein
VAHGGISYTVAKVVAATHGIGRGQCGGLAAVAWWQSRLAVDMGLAGSLWAFPGLILT